MVELKKYAYDIGIGKAVDTHLEGKNFHLARKMHIRSKDDAFPVEVIFHSSLDIYGDIHTFAGEVHLNSSTFSLNPDKL